MTKDCNEIIIVEDMNFNDIRMYAQIVKVVGVQCCAINEEEGIIYWILDNYTDSSIELNVKNSTITFWQENASMSEVNIIDSLVGFSIRSSYNPIHKY